MNDVPVGKPSPRRLQALLGDSLGARCAELLVGPGPGLDAAVLRLADGRVMAVAEDPIFPAVNLPLELMGWFTTHIGASDVAVTGVRPRYMTYTLLLPPSASEGDARSVVTAISHAAAELGISIVGGHTGWYAVVNVPIVGGVTVWGFADQAGWVSPAGARDGDVILLTKGPAVEAAALLAVLYRDRLAGKVGAELLQAACGRCDQISVVRDALTAFAAGGVHAMHDATEGGVLGGLWEMAASSGLQVRVDLDAVAVPPDIAAVAQALEFDPWRAISEGTLLAAVQPARARDVLAAWSSAGIEAWPVGGFSAAAPRSSYVLDGEEKELGEPGKDPFWDIFFAGLG